MAISASEVIKGLLEILENVSPCTFHSADTRIFDAKTWLQVEQQNQRISECESKFWQNRDPPLPTQLYRGQPEDPSLTQLKNISKKLDMLIGILAKDDGK